MPEFNKKQSKTPRSVLKPQTTTQQSTHAGETKEDGISIDYFIKFCSFLSGSLPHINKRILVAQGKSYQVRSCFNYSNLFQKCRNRCAKREPAGQLADLPRALLHLWGRLGLIVTLDSLLDQVLRSISFWQVPQGRILGSSRRIGPRCEPAQAKSDYQTFRSHVPKANGPAKMSRWKWRNRHGPTGPCIWRGPPRHLAFMQRSWQVSLGWVVP